jgi:hypothetical protein
VLITYLRELIGLLRKADDDPEFASQVARLVALQERLESG